MSREKEIERLKEFIATHSSFDIIAHTSIVFGKRFMIDGFNVTFSELEFNDLMQTNGMQFGFEDAKPKNFRFKLDDHKQDNSGNNDIDGFTMK